jgi:hypothetical protein
VQIPSLDSLAPGVEPLPDLRWVTLRPASVRIAPRSEYEIEVSLRVPPDKKLRGKTFAFHVITSIEPEEGKGIKVLPALLSRVKFAVESR